MGSAALTGERLRSVEQLFRASEQRVVMAYEAVKCSRSERGGRSVLLVRAGSAAPAPLVACAQLARALQRPAGTMRAAPTLLVLLLRRSYALSCAG